MCASVDAHLAPRPAPFEPMVEGGRSAAQSGGDGERLWPPQSTHGGNPPRRLCRAEFGPRNRRAECSRRRERSERAHERSAPRGQGVSVDVRVRRGALLSISPSVHLLTASAGRSHCDSHRVRAARMALLHRSVAVGEGCVARPLPVVLVARSGRQQAGRRTALCVAYEMESLPYLTTAPRPRPHAIMPACHHDFTRRRRQCEIINRDARVRPPEWGDGTCRRAIQSVVAAVDIRNRFLVRGSLKVK